MAPRAKAGENSGKVKGAGSTPGTMQTVMEMTRRNTALKQPEPWEGEALLTFATKFQIPRSTERYLSFDPCGVGIEEAGEPGGYRSAYILVHDRGATRYMLRLVETMRPANQFIMRIEGSGGPRRQVELGHVATVHNPLPAYLSVCLAGSRSHGKAHQIVKIPAQRSLISVWILTLRHQNHQKNHLKSKAILVGASRATWQPGNNGCT
ncbi:predicted protein [Histoplasma capsulatum var. duboisii H88]|uniref:Predicted protein n=1 Tax=Ajellomyces capsulatus (strain H88) TaxID=544711 RepID=F0UUU8_AJEC8|nr:predicted protein [Histoplasma capsulatum var. duboisii H88]